MQTIDLPYRPYGVRAVWGDLQGERADVHCRLVAEVLQQGQIEPRLLPVASCGILWQWKCRSNVFTKILASQLKAFDFDLGRFWKYSVSGAVQQRSHPRPFLVFSLGDPTFQGEPGHKGPPALERGTPSLEVRWLRWLRWLKPCRHWSQQSTWHPDTSSMFQLISVPHPSFGVMRKLFSSTLAMTSSSNSSGCSCSSWLRLHDFWRTSLWSRSLVPKVADWKSLNSHQIDQISIVIKFWVASNIGFYSFYIKFLWVNLDPVDKELTWSPGTRPRYSAPLPWFHWSNNKPLSTTHKLQLVWVKM